VKNCSPNSSESTGPPGSPQQEEEEEEEEVEVIDPSFQQHAYVYPGYMFGPAVYNVNGKTKLDLMLYSPVEKVSDGISLPS